ncbi:hypothetical protein [Risungbinella massiliensis]|uniref:hypothetical protein n=1 Tax=Risungbinella massiliensis TaxID=1329796 RepID=UPI0012B64530|nr:hypothetical protein [Risungbinella massiliensis]
MKKEPKQKQQYQTEFADELSPTADPDPAANPVMNAIQQMYSQAGDYDSSLEPDEELN